MKRSRHLRWLALTSALAAVCAAGCDGANPVPQGDVSTVDAITDDDADAAVDDTGADPDTSVDTVGQDVEPGTDVEDTSAGTDATTPDVAPDVAPDATKPDATSPDGTGGPDEPQELLVKILGPSGREWAQNEGQKIQLSGAAFGAPEAIEWSSNKGKSGTITPKSYWISGTIELEKGDNVLTVTAKKGGKTVVDTVRITYNPFFSFEGAPDVAPNVLFVGESAKLVVHMPVAAAAVGTDGKSVVDPGSIKLIEVDAMGNQVQEHSTLVDSGQGSNCDDVQKDSVYSNCVNLTPNAPKTLYFRVKAKVDIFGQQYDALSPVTVVDVVERFNKAECNQIVALQKKVKADYLAALAASGPAQAQADAIAALKADASVAEAGPASGGGYGVWVRYKTGRVGALNLAPAGMRAGGGAPGPAIAGTGAALPTHSVGTRRALALAPFASEFKSADGGDEADQAGGALKAKQCPPFAVDAANGSGAFLRYYREMSTYGLVAISGHGDVYFDGMESDAKQALGWEHLGAQEVIWSGEAVNCAALSGSTASCNKQGGGCPTGETCVKTDLGGGKCVDHTQGDIMKGRVVIGDETYGLLPSFVQRHTVEPFPASIVYLGACRTMYNGSLAVQLYGNGAAAVIGYSDYVTNKFAYEQGWKFLEGVVSKGQSVIQALPTTAADPQYGSRMRRLGNDKANANDSSLINPSWDLGKPTGWKQVGDGRVISRLGVTIPVAGKFMGIISTGLGFTAQNGSLEQPFCIPAAKNEMCFFWKFYSEEFIEYCGSSFMDRFTATLTADAGKLTMVDVWIDQLCPYDCGGKNACEPGSPSCKCGQQWKTLTQADIIFDQGGVYMTPWQKSCKDISPLSGTDKKVDLKFFATDVGDSIFDTAILIDEVTVQ